MQLWEHHRDRNVDARMFSFNPDIGEDLNFHLLSQIVQVFVWKFEPWMDHLYDSFILIFENPGP